MEPLAYRIDAAAKAIGLSRSRMYELIASGEIEARKIGGATVIPAESLRALIANAPEKQAA